VEGVGGPQPTRKIEKQKNRFLKFMDEFLNKETRFSAFNKPLFSVCGALVNNLSRGLFKPKIYD